MILFGLILLAACDSRISATLSPQIVPVGKLETVFVGTTRARNQNGVFGTERSEALKMLELVVSVPPNRKIGEITTPTRRPKPARQFIISSQRAFAQTTGFQSRLKTAMKDASSREVTVYIHGYNNTLSDAAFRMAQLDHDLEIPGPSIVYSWPSKSHPLGYEYDNDSALFARDGLQELLETTRAAGATRILLVAHSMGAHLVMETLRQIDLVNPGWSARAISGVILISPDIDVDVFKSQARQIKPLPKPFVIFVSKKDVVLRLSAGLAGQDDRLGNLANPEDLSDLEVEIVDVTAFSRNRWTSHFVPGTSPALLAILSQSRSTNTSFLRGHSGSSRNIKKATEIILAPRRR